ncbi:unnamed protein product [Gordionus sp. m RMFG-2023]
MPILTSKSNNNKRVFSVELKNQRRLAQYLSQKTNNYYHDNLYDDLYLKQFENPNFATKSKSKQDNSHNVYNGYLYSSGPYIGLNFMSKSTEISNSQLGPNNLIESNLQGDIDVLNSHINESITNVIPTLEIGAQNSDSAVKDHDYKEEIINKDAFVPQYFDDTNANISNNEDSPVSSLNLQNHSSSSESQKQISNESEIRNKPTTESVIFSSIILTITNQLNDTIVAINKIQENDKNIFSGDDPHLNITNRTIILLSNKYDLSLLPNVRLNEIPEFYRANFEIKNISTLSILDPPLKYNKKRHFSNNPSDKTLGITKEIENSQYENLSQTILQNTDISLLSESNELLKNIDESLNLTSISVSKNINKNASREILTARGEKVDLADFYGESRMTTYSPPGLRVGKRTKILSECIYNSLKS